MIFILLKQQITIKFQSYKFKIYNLHAAQVHTQVHQK